MKSFTAATSLLAGLGLVAALPQAPDPNTYENIDIAEFSARKDIGQEQATSISSVYFKINGTDATDLVCEASNPAFPSEVITCGETKYRFALYPSEDESYEFALRLYHELGVGFGFYGEGSVPTYCHAGGNGPNDMVCSQVNPTTIVIDAQ